MKPILSTINFIVILFLLSCNGKNMQYSIANKDIPAYYNNQNDTSNKPLISRNEFIGDAELIALIDTALKYNNDLQIAYQKIEKAKANQLFYKGALLPQVQLGASTSVRKFGLYTMDGAGNSTTDIKSNTKVPIDLPDYWLGIQSSWELDIRGKLNNQKKAAIANYLSSEETVKYIQTNLVAEIAMSYYNLIALDEELEILNANAKKQEEALFFIQAQKEAGKANELAVQQFNTQLMQLGILEQEVKRSIALEEHNLNYLIGRFPEKINRSKQNLYADNSCIHVGLPSSLLLNRPDIKAAQLALKGSHFDLKAANAAFYPSFTMGAGLGFQAFNTNYLLSTPESMAYNIVGGLMMPLINKSAIKANFKYATANQIESAYLYQQKIIAGFVEVSNELSDIAYLKKMNQIVLEKNKVNKLAVDNALSLYKSARSTYLDVLITQQNALQSELDVISIAKRLKLANVKLYKSLGGGWR